MISKIFSKLINITYAAPLIPCEDGTLADTSIGCVEAPAAIVSSQSEILNILLKIADSFTTIAISLSIIVLIYGGILYAMSVGNEEKIKTAKTVVFWSVFGLILTLLAKSIVSAVLIFIQ